MTSQQRGLGTAFVDQIADVAGQPVDVVGLHAVRLRGQVVAAHVGRDDAESGRRERFDLQPPAVPELGEAVQQDDQRPIAGFHVMQSLVADLGVALTKLALGCAHYRLPGLVSGRARRERSFSKTVSLVNCGLCSERTTLQTAFAQANKVKMNLFAWRCYGGRVEIAWSPFVDPGRAPDNESIKQSMAV